METIRKQYGWIFSTLLGSLIFALGFDFFLAPNDLNSGGISGLAMVVVELLGFGSVGTLSILINLPLFALGGIKIGRRFFMGSVIGMISTTISFRLTDAKSIRRYGLISSPSWLIYNIANFAIGAIICEVLSLGSIILGIIRLDRKK